MARTCESAPLVSHGRTHVRERHDIRLENIIVSELLWSRTRQPSRLVRRQLQRPEKRRVQRISVDVVKAEMMDGDLGFTGCLRVVPFKCEGMGLANGIENRVQK